jgi:hypothetical protein
VREEVGHGRGLGNRAGLLPDNVDEEVARRDELIQLADGIGHGMGEVGLDLDIEPRPLQHVPQRRPQLAVLGIGDGDENPLPHGPASSVREGNDRPLPV